jgi:AcrR family transcriptional regulator
MAALPQTSPPAVRRGRRPKTQAAVLRATAELLRSVSLADLTVAQILEASGASRSSFYEHFGSKDDVVLALAASVTARAAEDTARLFAPTGRPVEETFREGMIAWLHGAEENHQIWLAATEGWPRVPELRALWFGVGRAVGEQIAAVIERDRAAGLAPAGADAQALGAALAWTTERAFHVALFGGHATLSGVESIVEPLVQLYVGTIYGRPVAPPAG